jgi:hypothetical protein
MLPWAGIYAVAGASGRKLLEQGEDLGDVFADLSGVIEGDVEVGGEVALVAAAGVALFFAARAYRASQAGHGGTQEQD